MNTWFWSDTHFSHSKILEYCNRPFKNIYEMDRELVRRFNERVKEEDICFHLGDWGFKKSKEAPNGNNFEYFRNQLKCKNIICIKGSHDSNNGNKTKIESLVIKYDKKYINLVHDPKYANTLYPFNFCGHVHQLYKFKQLAFAMSTTTIVNLSVDVWNFYPVTYSEIIRDYYKWIKGGRK